MTNRRQSRGRRRTVRVDGERFRRLRIARGLSQEALAELSSGPDRFSIATVKRAEASRPLYPSSVAALARTLGCGLTELLQDLAIDSWSSPEEPPGYLQEAALGEQCPVAPSTLPDLGPLVGRKPDLAAIALRSRIQAGRRECSWSVLQVSGRHTWRLRMRWGHERAIREARSL